MVVLDLENLSRADDIVSAGNKGRRQEGIYDIIFGT